MKKALIFDPYLDTLGGGERYSFAFALGLLSSGYSVEIAWKDPETLKMAEDRFGLDLSKIKLNKKAYDLCVGKTSLIRKFLFTIHYSLIFWVSDGSLPFLFSRNNLIHFQVPFMNIGGNSLISKIKTLFVHKFVYNSLFTASIHEKHFPKSKSFILYPPIDVDNFKPGKKENIILSVGRFDSPSHSKRQDILIEAFRSLNRSCEDYQLFLAGGSRGSSDTLENLKEKAGSLPVKFVVNPDFDKLKDLYAKSKFFWHAAGYDVNEQADPEKVEHFGMTTVEAMAAGCVPVVIGKGGQKEIISAGEGFLCTNAQEITQKTFELINNPKIYHEMSNKAVKRSKIFSKENFNENIKLLS